MSAANHTITATNTRGNSSGVVNLEVTGRLDWFKDKLNDASLTDPSLQAKTSINLSNRSPQLTSLPVCIFSGLTTLSQLNLDNNALVSLDAGIFSGLTALEWLYLDNNALSSLPNGIFAQNTALTTLNLKGTSDTNTFTCSVANYRLWWSNAGLMAKPAYATCN